MALLSLDRSDWPSGYAVVVVFVGAVVAVAKTFPPRPLLSEELTADTLGGAKRHKQRSLCLSLLGLRYLRASGKALPLPAPYQPPAWRAARTSDFASMFTLGRRCSKDDAAEKI